MNEKKEKNCPEQRKVKVDATPFTTPHNPPKQVSPSRRVPTNTMPFLAQMNTEEIMPAVRKLRTDSSSSDGSGEEGPDREAEIHFPDDAGSSQSAAATSVIPAATARSSSSSSSSSVGQTNVVENRTYINTLNGPLHIGPSLSVSNVQCHHGPSQQSFLPTTRSLSLDEKEKIMTRSRVRRRVRPDEVLSISRCIGAGWKHLGNALKFSYAQLDQIESEKPDSLQDRVEYMLLLWINWQCEKATVNSLTKQLFKHKEYDAILAIKVQNE